MRSLITWLCQGVRLAARARIARPLAIAGASAAVLSGAQSVAAAPACPGTDIFRFVTRPGIVGWSVAIGKSPQCAFPSLVVVMDLIEADRKVHKLNFTLQWDAANQKLVKALGIDEKFPNLYYAPEPGGTHSFVLSHHYILGEQIKITRVKVFATFAGHACRYEGPASEASGDPIITICRPPRPH